jgi:hypothetical protein
MTTRRKFIASLAATVSWAAIARAATFTGTGVDDQGNTINFTLKATIAPATIYVAANGNDANNGKSPSTPLQTIAKVNSLLLARGGSVLFNGGDTFVGNLVPNIDGNGLQSSPLTIGSYWTGKATLVASAGGETGVINIEQMSGVVIQDLIIRGGDLAHMPRAGIRIGNNSATRRGGITIQRCDIGNITYFEATAPAGGQGTQGFHILLAGFPGTGGIENITILDSKLHGVNGPTSHDDVGIGGFGNGSNIFNVHIKNCEVYNIGGGPRGLNLGLAYPPMGDGIALDGVSGSLVEFCTTHDLGANYRNPSGGPAGFLTANCVVVKFSRCLAYNIAPSDFSLTQVDFVGFDLENDSNGCTIDSCYAHDCYNSGFMLFSNGDAGWNNNTITNCISENNCRGGLPGFGEICVNLPGASNPTMTVTNNTTFNNRVYNGQLYHNDNQGAVGLAITGGGVFQGVIKQNIHVTNVDIYGLSTPLNARTNTGTFTPSVAIANNTWFCQAGGMTLWWANQQYFALAAWQGVSGKGAGTQLGNPNFSAVGMGPAGYVQTTFPGWGATPQASYGST